MPNEIKFVWDEANSSIFRIRSFAGEVRNTEFVGLEIIDQDMTDEDLDKIGRKLADILTKAEGRV